MKAFVTLTMACCLSVGAGMAAAQDKSAMKKEMTAADCKSYMDMAAKDAKMKDASKDAACKAMMDKMKK
jgi:hypothetical protein